MRDQTGFTGFDIQNDMFLTIKTHETESYSLNNCDRIKSITATNWPANEFTTKIIFWYIQNCSCYKRIQIFSVGLA